MNKPTYRFWLAAIVSLSLLTDATISQAQIASDGTVSTKVTSPDGYNFEISGGRQVGGNLFHSFSVFLVITGSSAIFNNSLNVQNIISRVTGNSISSIDGLISTKGNANFFLINPNGIILGPNALLDIGGSVVFSTADRLNFADGSFFSATNTKVQSLLTISVPTGLQFGSNPGQITSYATSEDPQIRPDKTLALVGSGVVLDGANLFSDQGGRIEIGSVAANSFVGLTAISKGWSLNYDAVRDFQDIQLSGATVGGVSADGIQLRGRQITITNDSLISTLNLGADPGGNIVVRASKSIEISSGGALSTTTGIDSSTGAAGDVDIETQQFIVSNDSSIRTTTQGSGQGGNINVNAAESLAVEGLLSQLVTQTFGSGNAGDLNLTTRRLVVRDGGRISASASSPITGAAVSGNAGRINVTAFDSVQVSGQGVPSGLFAETSGPSTTGNGGDIRVSTNRLTIQNGGTISVSADRGSTGQAGSLNINAAFVVDSGSNSTILAKSTSPNPAGDVTINTDQLLIENGASVNVNSQGSGRAGNLFVSAHSVKLSDQGQIAAASNSGSGGNIALQISNMLLLRNNSQISTTAGITQGSGDGGNISFNGGFIVAVPNENSDISANAFTGKGGNIQINAQGVYGTQFRPSATPLSDITASSQYGVNGTVTLNTPNVNPVRGTVALPTGVIDPNALIANSCVARSRRQGRFIVTGTGGLSTQPDDLAIAAFPTYDLIPDAAKLGTIDRPQPSSPSTVEADGIYRLTTGEVVLGRLCP